LMIGFSGGEKGPPTQISPQSIRSLMIMNSGLSARSLVPADKRDSHWVPTVDIHHDFLEGRVDLEFDSVRLPHVTTTASDRVHKPLDRDVLRIPGAGEKAACVWLTETGILSRIPRRSCPSRVILPKAYAESRKISPRMKWASKNKLTCF
jgi:hypothetical protein